MNSGVTVSPYLRIQLGVPSNSAGVMMFVSEATEAAQYALLHDRKTTARSDCKTAHSDRKTTPHSDRKTTAHSDRKTTARSDRKQPHIQTTNNRTFRPL